MFTQSVRTVDGWHCQTHPSAQVATRRKALAELRSMLTKQEDGLSRAEDQVRTYELLQRGVEDRFRALQQQQEQKRLAEAAAAASAAAAQQASAAAALVPPPPLPNYATALPPHLAGMVPLGPAGQLPGPAAAVGPSSAMVMEPPAAAGSSNGAAVESSSNGGGGYQTMGDDLDAQLAAHLSNQDNLNLLAKSLAEFMPPVRG